MSPGLCRRGVEAHVVHDIGESAPQDYRGVQLHAVSTTEDELGGDRRWALFETVLRKLHAQRRTWACAWAVDLDVAVVELPRCSQMPSALHVGSDACSTRIKSWLAGRSRSTRLNDTFDESFRSFLSDNSTVYNSGAVGGTRDVFKPALHWLVTRLRAFRATAVGNATRHLAGADMLLWNLAARSAVASATGVVTGYPHGPVNLPMWAKPTLNGLCASTSRPLHPGALQSRTTCNSNCGYSWLNSSGLGRYYLGHKLPRSWLNMLRLHTCYPNASRTALGHHTLKRTGFERFKCECGVVGEPRPSIRSPEPVWTVE